MYSIGSTFSGTVDRVFLFIIIVSVILLALITFLMVYFVIKYQRKKHPRSKPVKDNTWLEIIWTIVPTVIVLAMFFYGYQGFKTLRSVPDDAMVVHVTGRMWDWDFEYENGKKSNKLIVPIDKPVKLIMKSVDVIHSFYIPVFRIKEDVLPDRETYLWFKPQSLGPADIFCAEYCGERHAFMLSQVIVKTEDEFQTWVGQPEPGGDLFEDSAVKTLFEANDCLLCHSLDDSRGERLSLKGIYGSERTVLANGVEQKVTVDEAYLTRALLQPEAEVVKGQIDSMPATEGISEEEIKIFIEFLKQLK